jgi:putative addiction module component (TIGR02574 family)
MLSNADLLKLDVATRLDLIEALWDSIANDETAATQLPLTEAERAMLDERLREYREDPEAGQSWAEVRSEILKQRCASDGLATSASSDNF